MMAKVNALSLAELILSEAEGLGNEMREFPPDESCIMKGENPMSDEPTPPKVTDAVVPEGKGNEEKKANKESKKQKKTKKEGKQEEIKKPG